MPPKKKKNKNSKIVKRRPLKGRTILVTQAEQQAKRFTALLKKKGAIVLNCPTIEIAPYETEETAKILHELHRYDWLVFMSQNAVTNFFDQLKKCNIPKSKLKGRRVAAIGKTTREILKMNNLRVHLVPQVFRSEHLVAAFKGRIEEKRFLVLTSVGGRTVVQDELKKKGAHVDSLPLYKTLIPLDNAPLLKRYVTEEIIDAVTFTSPSTFENFLKLLNPDRQVRRYLETMTIAALGDVTSKAVEDEGLRVRVKPSEFTIPAFVNTLSREL